MSVVYCAAENIPNTTSNAFDSTPVKTATLHVPNRSIHLYKESIPWSKFGNFAGLYGSTYSLSYIIDDGTEYKSYNVWEDEKITPEDEPAKEGYTFSGWSEIPEWMPAHDVTVAGAFNINLYKLTYMVDGEEYKSYEVEYGATITPEAAPTKEGYTFSGWSEIPQTMPAKDVTITGTFTQKPLPECAPPVIDVIGGKLKLSCETEAVTFNTNVTYNSSSKNLEGDEEIVLSGDIICHISVFASKEGYQNSDTVTKDVKLRVGAAGDANADGEVDIADAVHIVNFIVGKIDQLAPQKDMDQTDPE